MKKMPLFLLICLSLLPLNAYAFEESENFNEFDNIFNTTKTPFRTENRVIELGFNFGIGISNNFLRINEIFRETLVLDFDNISNGFGMNMGLDYVPFYFNYKTETWGIGLSANFNTTGALRVSENLISLNLAENDKSEASAAAFVSAGIDSFFHVKKFKISFRPAVFFPIAYLKTELSYSVGIERDFTVNMEAYYDIKIYTAFPLEDIDRDNYLSGFPGFDFSLGVAYPLAKEIGLQDRFPIFNFDVGLDLINIPIYGSRLDNYMHIFSRMASDDFIDGAFYGGGWEYEYIEDYDASGKRLYRPFKSITWVSWKPIPGSSFLTLNPSVGFAINPIYVKPLHLETGFNMILSFANTFITTAGIRYDDRVWINSFDLALNVRMFEINLGASLQSPSFTRSFDASGLGVSFGFKTGW